MGCLLVFLGVCVLIYLAVTSHWQYALGIAGLILFWGLIGRMRERSLRRKLLGALTAACSDCGASIPRLVEDSSYGWPTFELVFPSASELKLAEESGCVAAFKQAVQSLHSHIGDKENPFDAERAVWVTCEGHPHADPRT
jgi:hypothetical protein